MIRSILRKHALMVGAIAVTVPLLIIFCLQYRTLSTLGQTLPAYRKQVLDQSLKSIIEGTVEYYSKHAERTLDVPVGKIDFKGRPVISDSIDCSASLKAVNGVAEHFAKQDFKGAKRYFLAVATEHDGEERGEIFFYDPNNRRMKSDPRAPEMVAINVACASYLVYIRAGTFPISPYAMGVDRDPRYRMIVKPMVDERKRVQAVAGMLLDQDFLMESLLPEMIRKGAAGNLPRESWNALVILQSGQRVFRVYDATGGKVGDSVKEFDGEAEASQPFSFVLNNMRLSLRPRDMTVKQWTERSLLVNLGLWTLMTILLLAGIILMVRTASREMKLTQMKADFVSNVSHELRTPLASIRVLAELLNLGRVKDPLKVCEYGGYIESEGRRLTQLINNILDFSRIESDNKAYHFGNGDLRDLLEETINSFTPQIRREGFKLDYHPPDDPLPPVNFDADAIILVISNLIDNAMKYSGSSKQICLRLARENDFVVFSVKDYGIGIPPEEHEKIFEKFYRVSTGMVHDVKGSGLGLSLVKHIVEAHRGMVTVESEPGRGSTFTVRFQISRLGASA